MHRSDAVSLFAFIHFRNSVHVTSTDNVESPYLLSRNCEFISPTDVAEIDYSQCCGSRLYCPILVILPGSGFNPIDGCSLSAQYTCQFIP
jgi:hypothetical protein